MRRTVVGIVGLVGLAATAACTHHAAPRSNVPVVIAGAASSWPHVLVVAGGRTAEVGADLKAKMAPLLGTRAFTRPQPLAEYGLDRPQAQLSYRAGTGRTTTVLVGTVNFDRHFFYVKRPGQATVYLVAADALRPVLALIGIEVAPPD